MVEFKQRLLARNELAKYSQRGGGGLAEPQLRVYKKDPRAKLPVRSPESAIGLDVFAFLLTESGRPSSRAIHLKGVTSIPTGLIVQPPPGYFIQTCSRSGLAQRGVFVANSPGVIDPDYTGELFVLLFNGGYETQYVAHE